jgi:hypothetical protein
MQFQNNQLSQKQILKLCLFRCKIIYARFGAKKDDIWSNENIFGLTIKLSLILICKMVINRKSFFEFELPFFKLQNHT